MIITMKKKATETEIQHVVNKIKNLKFKPHIDKGITTVIGIRGDTSSVEIEEFYLPGVEKVCRVTKRYKEVSREFKPQNTVVSVGGVKIGNGVPVIMAGPCSVESEDQIRKIAKKVKALGANILRGGAFKPRTSPYLFQGLGVEGLRLLKMVKDEFNIPVATEIMNPSQIELFESYDIDIYQVGTRNMHNYDLLRELGKTNKPLILKRGFSSTVEEFLLSAEYILYNGNSNVILCERGIKTFESSYRNVLDLNCVALIKQLSHLPIVVDPSHATGMRLLVPPLSLAALACGADGLLIEVHNEPQSAKSDANQQLNFDEFEQLMTEIKKRHGKN